MKNKKFDIKQKESNIVKACIECLQWHGFIVLRNNSGFLILQDGNNKKRAVKLGLKGSSDIIACSPNGRFVAIECKTKNGKLTEDQKRFLDEVQKKGGITAVVRSIDDVLSFIEKHKMSLN